jgi:hypothetical protein
MSVHDELLSIDTGQCTNSHYQFIIVKTYPNSNLNDTNKKKEVRQFKLNVTKYLC